MKETRCDMIILMVWDTFVMLLLTTKEYLNDYYSLPGHVQWNFHLFGVDIEEKNYKGTSDIGLITSGMKT